jgi:hypothetical protein
MMLSRRRSASSAMGFGLRLFGGWYHLGIVGRKARMRREKSGAPSAAFAASLIKERRRSSSNGSDVSILPDS